MENKTVIIKDDGLMYCPHCGNLLDRVIVEVKGWAVLRANSEQSLGMTSYQDFEAEEYLTYECGDCGGEINER